MIPIVEADAPAAAIAEAARESGAFQVRLPPDQAARVRDVLAVAAAFFARKDDDKRALDIRHSPHHRGFSEMHNARDWREQLHLGRESPPSLRPHAPAYEQLIGPNQWPPGDDALRAALLSHLDETAQLGARLATALDLPRALFADDPHLVMKLICYHPQPSPDRPRPGVAAHVDYSLVTLLAEDDSGGLEVQRADGSWFAVEPRPDALLVNLGEIAEAVSGGALRATPHRVINRSLQRARVSIPVFVNPALSALVTPRARVNANEQQAYANEQRDNHSPPPAPRAQSAADVRAEHVHRVLATGELAPFVFGDGEWRRKGENVWCAECCK